MKSLHKVIGSERLSFGRPELLMEVLGVSPGSVTPFALINDTARRVTVILDADMMRYERLNYHPLANTATTNIARDDLLSFIRACGHEPRILAVASASERAS
jgi:Ala-tRNA(Pro) deacylase